MKTKILALVIGLTVISNVIFAQLQITNYGSIGMGFDPSTRTDYKQFIKGDLMLTTYPDIPAPLTRYTELRFQVGDGWPGAQIGTPYAGVVGCDGIQNGKIAFWASECGYNTIYVRKSYEMSDRALKANETTINNGLEIVRQLVPYSYNMKDTIGGNISAVRQYGLIAQDVNNILPEITDTAKGIMFLDYLQLIPFVIQGEKQLDSTTTKLNGRIDSLKNIIATYASRFDSLESMINRCCSQGQNAKATPNGQTGNSINQSNVQYVKLSTESAIILNQNDPNPFAEETDITYFLPETVGNATIMFYDNTGVIIKSVQLQSKGNGTLHVYASDLSSGMYTYALIVDGKLIDSKKMVKTK